MFGKIREQISENPRRSRGFSPAREFSQALLRFSTDKKEQKTCFISLIKLIFSLLTKRKTIYEARTVNSQRQSNHIAHTIFVLHSFTLVDQSKHTYCPNYFIN